MRFEAVHPRRIRAAAAADVPAVVDLFRRFMREIAQLPNAPDTAAYVERAVASELSRLLEYYLDRPRQGFWVMEEAGRITGSVGIERVGDDTAELRRLMVDAHKRRAGRGGALLGHVERFCARTGYRNLVLGTSTLQPAAVALYERAGFVRVAADPSPVDDAHKALEGASRLRYSKRLDVGLAPS